MKNSEKLYKHNCPLTLPLGPVKGLSLMLSLTATYMLPALPMPCPKLQPQIFKITDMPGVRLTSANWFQGQKVELYKSFCLS